MEAVSLMLSNGALFTLTLANTGRNEGIPLLFNKMSLLCFRLCWFLVIRSNVTCYVPHYMQLHICDLAMLRAFLLCIHWKSIPNYASLSSCYACLSSSGEAYSDQQLTLNLEIWVEIFLCADMFPYEDSKTVSVCPSLLTPRKEITLASSI